MASIVATSGLMSCAYTKSSGEGFNLSSRRATTFPSSFGSDYSKRLRPVVLVRAEAQHINPDIRKTEAKVVDTVVAPELSKPLTVYCRCWRSGTFPLCDGSHVKHNKATGDNVGPLLVKKE